MTDKEIRRLRDSRICLCCRKPIKGISIDGFCSDHCAADWDPIEREPHHPREDLEGEITPGTWLKRAAARAKKHFRYYSESVARKVETDGQEFMVQFHCLGCNASHWFYVGILPDGRLVTRWFGEEGETKIMVDGEEFYEPTYGEGHKVLAAGEYPKYLGHW